MLNRGKTHAEVVPRRPTVSAILVRALTIVAASPPLAFVSLHYVFQYLDLNRDPYGDPGLLIGMGFVVQFGALVLGPTMIIAATLGALVATLMKSVSGPTKIVLWAYVGLSWASLLWMIRHRQPW